MKGNTMKLLSMTAVLALLGAGATAASAATIVNLGFDPIQVGLPGTTGSSNLINPLGWNLPADNTWDLGYGPVDDTNIEANPKFPAEVFFHSGTTAIATGSSALGSDPIIGGNSYTISVLTQSVSWSIGNPALGIADVQTSLTVKTDDGSLLASQILVNSVADLNWASHDVTFVAPAEANGKYLKLEFTSNPATDTYGLISGISATTDAVPEPASLSLLGLGAVALLRRRK